MLVLFSSFYSWKICRLWLTHSKGKSRLYQQANTQKQTNHTDPEYWKLWVWSYNSQGFFNSELMHLLSLCIISVLTQNPFPSVKMPTCPCRAKKACLACGLQKWIFLQLFVHVLYEQHDFMMGRVFEGFGWVLLMLVPFSTLCWCPPGTGLGLCSLQM